MRIILITTFVMSFFMSGGLRYMVVLIRSLQLVLHLPLLKQMVTPGNVNMFFSIVIPIAMFDVLDQDISIDNLIEFDEEAHDEAILKNSGSVFD